MKKLLFVLLTALFAGTVTAQIPSVSILGDQPRMNCGIMPRTVRERLT